MDILTCIDNAAETEPAGRRPVAKPASLPSWVWPALCCAVVLSAILLAHPFNDIGFDDDWSYGRVALKLAQTGRLQYNGWGSPLELFQAIWAVPWIRLFGPSYPVLAASTIPVSLGAVLLVYATGRRIGLTRQLAAFCAIGVGTSPLFLPFAASFMTESYGCFFGTACAYCALRALQADDATAASRWLWMLALAGFVGGANRQSVWAAPLALIPFITWERRRERAVLLNSAAAFALLCAAIAATLHWFGQPYTGLQIGPGLWAWLIANQYAHALRFITEFFLLVVLLCVPAFAALLPKPKRKHLFWLPVGAGGLAILTVLGIIAGWPPAPYGNNMITIGGIAIGNQDSTGATVVVLQLWLRILLTAVVNLCVLRACGAGLRPAQAVFERPFLRVAAIFTLAYLPLLLPGALLSTTFDRYMLPLVPLLYLAIAMFANRRNPRMSVAWACLLLFAWYGIATTHDYAVALRARVSAARALERTGVSRRNISASFEYDGQGQLERTGNARGTQYGDRFQNDGPKGFWLDFWDHLAGFQPEFVVLNWTRPEAPHDCASFIEYRAWLPPFRRYSAVWKRADLTDQLQTARILSETSSWR